MPTPTFYFSTAAFLAFIGSGVYFFAWWEKSGQRHRFLLYWACGLGSMLLFKIPNILANAKVEIIQEDLYFFFFATLLAHFLAYFALILGFAEFANLSHGRLLMVLLSLWFVAAISYFAAGFLVESIGVIKAPVWVGHLVFYIPSQILLLYGLWRAARRPAEPFIVSNAGVALTAIGTISLLASSIFYILAQTGPYPAEFWYFAVISSPTISILQAISGVALFFGLRSFARSYLRTVIHE